MRNAKSKIRNTIGPGLFAGVGLTSLSTLMLQVSLTRIFSVALWHHFAFMVVSIAFLGYGASGAFLMILPKIRGRPMRPTLAKLALGLSVASLISYWCSNKIPFDPARLMWDRYQWIYLLGYYGVFAVPFFIFLATGRIPLKEAGIYVVMGCLFVAQATGLASEVVLAGG